MTKQNQLFEAMGNIDDDIAANAIKNANQRRRNKPLKIAAIAAAAVAALSLIVGATMPRTKSYGKIDVYYGVNDDDVVYLYPTPQKFSYPDYFVFEEDYCPGKLETLDEVRETFGVTPIINDNFTIGDKYGRRIVYHAFNEFDTDIPSDLEIEYFLYSKSLDDTVRISSIYYSGVNFIETGNGHNSYENVELITLKDGSQCVIRDDLAIFVFDGVKYSVDLSFCNKPHDNDNMKKVLCDLGVYDFTD